MGHQFIFFSRGSRGIRNCSPRNFSQDRGEPSLTSAALGCGQLGLERADGQQFDVVIAARRQWVPNFKAVCGTRRVHKNGVSLHALAVLIIACLRIAQSCGRALARCQRDGPVRWLRRIPVSRCPDRSHAARGHHGNARVPVQNAGGPRRICHHQLQVDVTRSPATTVIEGAHQ